ncbi:MAG TPA: V-type ATPase 116kDa subunit family protein, partial [Candidatus Thermoplasmatota archaeon]|nr:V-type ATPase 116kDa subunit family protein [Candidatus Thermoplasmatota archaeon]
ELAGGGAVGWAIYLLGFVLITVLAILSGGLQALRLQFVEFFGKFYTGGGRPYVPFGRRAA